MSDPQTFESLADPADFEQLKPYGGLMKAWILVKDKDLKIGVVANGFHKGLAQLVDEWKCYNQIEILRSLHEIPYSKNGWMVVCFEDVYFLKPYID